MSLPSSPTSTTSSRRSAQTTALTGSKVGLSVTLFSRAASITSTPLFYDCDTIQGALTLDIPKKRNVTRITISVYGTHRSATETVFLNISKVLWSRGGKSSPSDKDASRRELRVGANTWNFAIPLPLHCDAKAGGGPIPLPPTHSGPALPDTVIYEMQCDVQRGIFSEAEVLRIPFQYRPQIVARPGSRYRMKAYANGTPIPGPDIDPAGWKGFSASYCGDFFSRRKAQIDCEFFLATPLEYPRNYPIPFTVKIHCADEQVLSYLAAAQSFLSVSLRCRTFYNTAPAALTDDVVGSGQYDVVSRWPQTVELAGEIRTSGGLQPSFRFKKLAREYVVQFQVGSAALQFDLEDGSESIIEAPVSICTLPAEGPLPISYSRRTNNASRGSSDDPSPVSPVASIPSFSLAGVYNDYVMPV